MHGDLASALWWFELLADPPPGHRVLAPTLPGYGGTYVDPGADRSVAAGADWLAGWLNEREVTRPVLLGQGAGGAVVLELAAQAPDEIAGVVLVGAPLALDGPEPLETRLDRLFPSGRPAGYVQLLEDAGRAPPYILAATAQALRGWHPDPTQLAGVPLLVLAGGADPDLAAVQALAAALGTAPTVVPGRGAGLPQEDPLRFRALLTPFLLSCQRGRVGPEVS